MTEEEYKLALSQIIHLLNYYDVTGMAQFFAALGVENEFDIEAKVILNKIAECSTAEELVEMCNKVFNEYLNEETSFPLTFGESLLLLKQKYQWLQ